MALKGLKLLCDEASFGDQENLTSVMNALGATQCSLEDIADGARPDLLITGSVVSEPYKVLK